MNPKFGVILHGAKNAKYNKKTGSYLMFQLKVKHFTCAAENDTYASSVLIFTLSINIIEL